MTQLPKTFFQLLQFQGFDSSLRDGEWHRQLFQRICREHPQYRHSDFAIFLQYVSMLDSLILSWLHEGRLKCLGCSWAHLCNPSLQATICRLTLLHVDVVRGSEHGVKRCEEGIRGQACVVWWLLMVALCYMHWNCMNFARGYCTPPTSKQISRQYSHYPDKQLKKTR